MSQTKSNRQRFVELVKAGRTKREALKEVGSDGCTWAPDKLPTPYGWVDITEGCVEHDEAYDNGGTEEDKFRADFKFFIYVVSKAGKSWGEIYRWGVRKWGEAHWTFKNK